MKFKLLLVILLTFTVTSCSTSVIEKVEPPVADVTYLADVKTIIENNCTSCHGASNPVAGVDLSTYSLLRTKTEAGRVIARITNTAAPMPPAPRTRLTDAQIGIVQEWINDGYKEN